MLDFLKNLFSRKSDPDVFETLEKVKAMAAEAVEVRGSSKSISEPVLSIVKTFSEKGRWKILCKKNCKFSSDSGRSADFTFKDTKTNEEYSVHADCNFYIHRGSEGYTHIPKRVSKLYMPSWMTEQEAIYVVNCIENRMSMINERFQHIEDKYREKSQAVCKVNQQKERQRLMSIYYKE